VYGPVCTVVWEGRRRETSPYPDPWHFATLQAEAFDVRFRGIPDFDDYRLSISLQLKTVAR
jgi:hypothetical protein